MLALTVANRLSNLLFQFERWTDVALDFQYPLSLYLHEHGSTLFERWSMVESESTVTFILIPFSLLWHRDFICSDTVVR